MLLRREYFPYKRALLCAFCAGFATLTHAAPEDSKINLSALDNRDNHRFIVGFDASGRSDSGTVNAAIAEVARGVGLGLQVRRQLATGAHLIEVDSKLPTPDAAALMRAFARRGDVEYVEPDAMMQANFTPDDTHYGVQWHYFEAVAGMNLPVAWDASTGSGVVVAVLDTGQTNHEDLNGQFVAGYDFISDTFVSRDGDGRDVDPNDEGDWSERNDCYFGSRSSNSSWHGTHVAGTVAAATNNNQGVAGVAFDAKIQPVRVLGRCGGYLSDIADAIVWASGGSVSGVTGNATPAQVINMSLGGSGSCGATYQNAINTAVNSGATVVVSAGNSNANAANYRPANCNNVITVAASDREGNRASYSNYGSSVEITAPGGESGSSGVASTLNDGSTVQTDDIYVYYQGTSMAAPHISGLAALMYSLDPGLTPAGVLQLMQGNARLLAGSCSGGCGAGLADAAATLSAMGAGGPVDTPPRADFDWDCTELDCRFTNTTSDDSSNLIFSWNFGDGSALSSEVSPGHVYAAPGPYSVTLTVDDSVNDTVLVTKDITAAESLLEPPIDNNAPAAPGSVQATATTEGKGRNRTIVSATLSWIDAADNETAYEVERCVETGSKKNKVCNYDSNTRVTLDSGITSLQDDSPESGSRYRVRAVNDNGASAWVESNKI